MTDQAVLSVDVELFTQTPAYRSAAGEVDDRSVGIAGVDVIRDLLTEYGATATCFVVSSVADRHPAAVRALAHDGHEVGSHTHTHQLLGDLPPAEQYEELARSRAVLERVTGERVTGFRAPAFDLPPGHFAAVDAAGYRYDSSVVASRRIPGWYGGEHTLQSPASATAVDPDAPPELTELPVSVMPRLRLPLTGTWLRFFGPRYTMLGMRLLARRGIAPVLYVHPWEFVNLPAVEGVPARVYWHTGDWMRRAVAQILAQPFEFVTACSLIAADDDTEERRSRGDPPAGDGA